jgi:hypothetical protein
VQILESVQIVTREFIYPASKHETRWKNHKQAVSFIKSSFF